MEFAVRFYEATRSNEISGLFALVILAVLSLGLIARFFPQSHRLEFVEGAAPTMMTTLGVLGTFAGIYLGLLDFNVSDIDTSVPKLLEGLKIAFSTSIVGMGSAVVLRLFQTVLPRPGAGEGVATPETIQSTLKDINNNLLETAGVQSKALRDIRSAIAAEGDTSLLTQIQKLRTTVQDGQKDLITEFREFAKTMAENNSNALIEALEQVIRDFNTQLNEQFGENFQQLNSAVGALLEWQENYKAHVERLQAEIEKAVAGITSTEESLRSISERTEKIPATMETLKIILDELENATVEFEAHLETLADLRNRAVEAFPIIDNNLRSLTEGFSSAVQSAIEKSSDAVENQAEAFGLLQTGYESLNKKAQDAQSQFVQHFEDALTQMAEYMREASANNSKLIEETNTRFSETLNTALEGVRKELTQTLSHHEKAIESNSEEMRKSMADAWTKTQDAINEQMKTLDEQMQNELRRVIETMGRHLASLSEKFVGDYKPLADKLQKVVSMAERVA
ncbi:MAG: hypothetical protein RBS99_12025 [Rhodospirillales bacterium]|jgi:uncharacterized phage infection (PIP) family protein YhgE|nr:hypothetical protein [Rhodospirillales bacterium]